MSYTFTTTQLSKINTLFAEYASFVQDKETLN